MHDFIITWCPTICGLLFTIGAITISETGKIFIGSIIYLLADLTYLIYAINIWDLFGMVSLAIGLMFGIRTLVKMNIGIFIKNLKRESNEIN